MFQVNSIHIKEQANSKALTCLSFRNFTAYVFKGLDLKEKKWKLLQNTILLYNTPIKIYGVSTIEKKNFNTLLKELIKKKFVFYLLANGQNVKACNPNGIILMLMACNPNPKCLIW